MFYTLAALLLLTVPAPAKTIEQRLRWEQLPPELAGQRVKVARAANRDVSGRLVRLEPSGLVLEGRSAERVIARAEVVSIESSRRARSKWRIIGVAIGVGAAMPLLAIAEIGRKNEGGSYAGRNSAIAGGLVAAAGVAGYFAGRSADTDRTVIHILSQ
jgi:hypothetical protein